MSNIQGKFAASVQCCVLGIGQLVAWNTILTISDYYYEIFPDYHPARILTLVYQPFVLGTISILVYVGQKNKNHRRVMTGYCLFVIGTISLITVDVVTKGKGGLIPFLLLCIVAAGFGVANALVEGAMIGDLCCICPDLIQPFAAGLGVAGAITSALRLLTKAAFQNSPDGLRKVSFLAISLFIELVCVIIYGVMFPNLPIVQHYRERSGPNPLEPAESRVPPIGKLQLARQNFDRVLCLFLTYALTLSIFPGFLYENTGQHTLHSWYPLVLVTCFNVCDALSRYITLIKRLKMESDKWIVASPVARVLLVPAFYFTAQYADQGWMIFLSSFLGITNGYLTVCTLTSTPKKNYKVSEANALGNILVASMLGGIFAGACLSWLWLIDSKIYF